MIGMEQFLVAVGAVVPLFIHMAIGVLIRRARLLSDTELVHVNRMLFQVFFAIMMFYNLYTTNLGEVLRPRLILYGVGALAVVYVAAFWLVCRLVPGNKQRGALIQAIYRSNFVLMGIPMVVNIFGEVSLAVPTMMVAIIVPIYNVLGVFTLETFRGGTFDLLHILADVLRNPMILGALTGLTVMLLGIPLPRPVLKPLAQITAATGPLALIILGASFSVGKTTANLRLLVSCVAARLLIVPSVVLGTAVYLGFRGIELVTLVSIFATPCAVASYAMAQQMDSDADLAGGCVVFTSALSVVTMFCWVLFFSALGYI